ncbi:MAG: lytic transglycosylase domain-containing protein [Eubacteriales bacterium]|nr:lytic transglycosylase domain-containing protein [Eubacteriales bacterium]
MKHNSRDFCCFDDTNNDENNSKNRRSYIGKIVSYTVIFSLLAEILFLCFYFGKKIQKYVYPKRFSEYVTEYCAEYGVPQALIYATMKVESDFDSDAVSSAGACGIMQIMPKTFGEISELLSESVSDSDMFNTQINIKYGVLYLSMQYESFGCWEYAILAYNAGPQRVTEWLSDGKINVDDDKWDIPFEESAEYIKKIRRCADKYSKIYDMEKIKWKS